MSGLLLIVIVALVIYSYKKDPAFLNKLLPAPSLRKRPVSSSANTVTSTTGMSIGPALVGVFIGGLIGFLLRPAAPLIGQLPFEIVITRGSNLRGFDKLLLSIAEASFNHMLVGAMIGGAVGVFTGVLLKRGNLFPVETAPTRNKTQFQDKLIIPKQIELNQSLEQVVDVLGQPQKTINLGAKVIYVYEDMKIVFIDGKVSDVQ